MPAARKNAPSAAPIETQPKMPRKRPALKNVQQNAKPVMLSGVHVMMNAERGTPSGRLISERAMPPVTQNAVLETPAAQKSAAVNRLTPEPGPLSLHSLSALRLQGRLAAAQGRRLPVRAHGAEAPALKVGPWPQVQTLIHLAQAMMD